MASAARRAASRWASRRSRVCAGGLEALGVVAALLLGGFALGDIVGAFASGALEDLNCGIAALANGDKDAFLLVDGLDLAVEFDAGFLHGLFGFGQYQAGLFECGFAAGKAGVALFGDLAQFFELVLQRVELGAEGEKAMAT